MKTPSTLFLGCIIMLLSMNGGSIHAQAPQKLSYQAVIFDNDNALVKNTAIGMRISILHNSATGDVVFQEIYNPNPMTNGNGVVTVEIGTGNALVGTFEQIDWSSGPYYIKSESDLTGGTNYGISGTSQILSTPYALYANKSGDGFSGNYNDLSNKPVVDGSETKISAGSNVSISGTGTSNNPYVINSSITSTSSTSKVVFTATQGFTVPQGVSKIKVELWGGAGGGGGAGAYSYSYNLRTGGSGGGGGYASQEFDVTAGQQFDVIVGAGGSAGANAIYSNGYYTGDTDGGNGTDSHFSSINAAGGKGGKKGSFSNYTVNGDPGTNNLGSITAHPAQGGSNQLNVYTGIPRSYIGDRDQTSMPGTGGNLAGYSIPAVYPTSGEGGCAIITFFE
jgi:hypothetical protein